MPDIFLIDLKSGKTSSYKVDLSVSIHACIIDVSKLLSLLQLYIMMRPSIYRIEGMYMS